MNPMTGNTVSLWVAELGIWPLVVVLLPNLLFRRYGQQAGTKRMASLYQAIAIFAITTAASFVSVRELTDFYFFIAVGVVIVVVLLLRKRIFPYRLTCVECDAKLDFETIYFRDANLCISCRKAAEAEEEAAAAGAAGEIPEEPQEDRPWPGSAPDGGDDDDEPA